MKRKINDYVEEFRRLMLLDAIHAAEIALYKAKEADAAVADIRRLEDALVAAHRKAGEKFTRRDVYKPSYCTHTVPWNLWTREVKRRDGELEKSLKKLMNTKWLVYLAHEWGVSQVEACIRLQSLRTWRGLDPRV